MIRTSLDDAIAQLRAGGMILVTDDEDRENEGDLVCAADFATPANIAFMARRGSGLICLPMEGAMIDRLGLAPMTAANRTPRQTAFTVSIEARDGITTGISAADRARTVAVAIDPATRPEQIVSPGHMFPLRAVDGGVLARDGHTEGSVELMRMAGLTPAAVICEVMRDDGEMMRRAELEAMAREHDLPIVTIRDIIAARLRADGAIEPRNEPGIERVATAMLPSVFGETTNGAEPFTVHAFRNPADGIEHLAIVHGTPDAAARAGVAPLVRVHSECLTGDALGSLRCDCGPQLQAGLRRIAASPYGIVIYLRGHEGRGIGLANKIRAYALQDQGFDTVAANTHLGFGADQRDYAVAAAILRHLGVPAIDLLTNNPAKVDALRAHGLAVEGRSAIEIPANPHNAAYLRTKRLRMGHWLDEGHDHIHCHQEPLA